MHHLPPLEDLPECCPAEFLIAHLAEEREEGLYLPMHLGVQVTDDDAARINRAYEHLRAEGHGKLDTARELTEGTFPLRDRETR